MVALQVTGDAFVPSGQVAWRAAAAPLPQPWSDQEQTLIANRGWFQDREDADDSWPTGSSQDSLDGSDTDPAVAAIASAVPVVVSAYKGEGRSSDDFFSPPDWVDGRLWVYDDGDIGFVWLQDHDVLIDYQRLDSDLCVT